MVAGRTTIPGLIGPLLPVAVRKKAQLVEKGPFQWDFVLSITHAVHEDLSWAVKKEHMVGSSQLC
jgi:hypothetical protein